MTAEMKAKIIEYLEEHSPPTAKQAMIALFWTAVVMLLVTVLNGVSLKLCWDWFMVTLFELPPIPIMGALGVSLVGRAFVGTRVTSQDIEKASSDKPVSYRRQMNLLAKLARDSFTNALGLVMAAFIISRFI
jgi:hypothetical protein